MVGDYMSSIIPIDIATSIPVSLFLELWYLQPFLNELVFCHGAYAIWPARALVVYFLGAGLAIGGLVLDAFFCRQTTLRNYYYYDALLGDSPVENTTQQQQQQVLPIASQPQGQTTPSILRNILQIEQPTDQSHHPPLC
jgi:hypothetical protein